MGLAKHNRLSWGESACDCASGCQHACCRKELVLIDNNARTRVADLRMRSLPYLRADTAMYDLLKLFQTGRSHMVVLTQPPDAADGSVSRANSQDVTVQIEEAKERVSPEVTDPLLNSLDRMTIIHTHVYLYA